MKDINYQALKEDILASLKIGKNLGLSIERSGGYATGYSVNKLPEHRVGLFGALSIVKGGNARFSMGLNYEQTKALEDGFNGTVPEKRKNKYSELHKLGTEIFREFIKLSSPLKKKAKKEMGYMVGAAPGWPGPGGPVFYGNPDYTYTVTTPQPLTVATTVQDEAITLPNNEIDIRWTIPVNNTDDGTF